MTNGDPSPLAFVDLHAHYPMRVVQDVDSPRDTVKRMRRLRGRPLGEKVRAVILWIASALLSKRDWWSEYRIDVEKMRKGGVAVALSVLYRPFEEMDLTKHYGDPPEDDYFEKLQLDLQQVEDEVAGYDDSLIRIVRDRAQLDQAIADRAIALIHCVEGGFHLGNSEQEIEKNVACLAKKGVAYVTLAHLFFRQVATNAPALPFLKTDAAYHNLFPQPEGEGLTDRGKTAVRAMVKHRVMVDISHMRPAAIAETVRVMDEEDPNGEIPLIATHGGYRFGKQEYMLDEDAVRAIQRRKGVIGLILAQHQLNDGIRDDYTETIEESFEVIGRHIDKIAAITKSPNHVALGTDFDGFIKPTMGGLEHMGDLSELGHKLRERYGDDAELIASRNAIDVLRQLWPE
jgi:microsomal dipeptidase-like Zn-dependent dipeptidase